MSSPDMLYYCGEVPPSRPTIVEVDIDVEDQSRWL